MDEVDKIIISTLSALGLRLESAASLADFDQELVYAGVVACVRKISGRDGFAKRLPKSMSARYKEATKLVNIIYDLGYTGELGYQSILYTNADDSRKLFVFLLEKLPKDDATSSSEDESGVGGRDKKWKARREMVKMQLKEKIDEKKWKPVANVDFRSRPVENGIVFGRGLPGSSILSTIISVNHQRERKAASYGKNLSKDLNEKNKQQISSLASKFSGLSISKPPVPSKRQKPPVPVPRKGRVEGDQTPVNEEKQTEAETASAEAEIRELESKLSELSSTFQKINTEISHAERRLPEMEIEKQSTAAAIETLERKLALSKKLAIVCDDFTQNYQSLTAAIDKSKREREKLEEKWSEHQEALSVEKQQVEKEQEERYSHLKNLRSEIKRIQADEAVAAEEKQFKLNISTKLERELETLKKDVPRSYYTKRILDIIENNVRKQRVEINRIIDDIKSVQKEINKLSGRLDRSYIEVNDLIFPVAKNDAKIRAVYRLVVKLHEDCQAIIKSIEEKGSHQREYDRIEAQIEIAKRQIAESNVGQLQEDLEAVQKENRELKARLK